MAQDLPSGRCAVRRGSDAESESGFEEAGVQLCAGRLRDVRRMPKRTMRPSGWDKRDFGIEPQPQRAVHPPEPSGELFAGLWGLISELPQWALSKLALIWPDNLGLGGSMETWDFYAWLVLFSVCGGVVSAGKPSSAGYATYAFRVFASALAGFAVTIGVKAFVWQSSSQEAYWFMALAASAVGIHIVQAWDIFAAKAEKDPSIWFRLGGKTPPGDEEAKK